MTPDSGFDAAYATRGNLSSLSLGSTVRRAYHWHRPLMLLAAACAVLLLASVFGLAVDTRKVTGVSIWNKPALFAISIAIYAVTLAWLISLMAKRRRLGHALGTVSAAMLAGELVAIMIQVTRGQASHFNFSTTFNAAVYQTMAVMIGILWLSNVALVVWLLTQRLTDLALTWALRLGMTIAVVGMALAFLMTLPSATQRTALDHGRTLSVIGAHSVGVPDGGPGLPIVGWSTVGGDLRIPHFIGLHGLQFMILFALGLGALARRHRARLTQRVQVRLVFTAAAAYTGLVAIVTWQALRGQSIIHPDAKTFAAVAADALLTTIAVTAILLGNRRSSTLHPASSKESAASRTCEGPAGVR